MFCKKCGQQNDDDAVYCKQCGTLLESEVETSVAPRSLTETLRDQPAAVTFSIGPTLKFVKAGYAAAIIGALLLVALAAIFTPVPVWLAVIFGLLLLLIPAFFHLRQKLVNYRLTDQCIEIDSGLISRTTRNIPLGRIQDVTVSSTVSQRLLNFGDVVIDNASEDGGKIVIRNIDSPRKYADMLLSQMRRLED
jgi:uncharacterized membrane protein YdbT with pleckstrin-like domain